MANRRFTAWDEEQKTLAPSGMAGASSGRRISTRERDGAENTLRLLIAYALS